MIENNYLNLLNSTNAQIVKIPLPKPALVPFGTAVFIAGASLLLMNLFDRWIKQPIEISKRAAGNNLNSVKEYFRDRGIIHMSNVPYFGFLPRYFGVQHPLRIPVERNNVELTDFLIENGVLIDEEMEYISKSTALIVASTLGCTRVAKWLMNHGADINKKNKHGIEAFAAACKYGYLDIAALLVNKNADLNSKDLKGLTPLMHACVAGHKGIVEFLIEKGANLSIKNRAGKTALDLAQIFQKTEIIELLLRYVG